MWLQENTLFADRYQLIRLLGRGGFSEVWLAEDRLTGLKVAIKVYAPGTGLDSDGMSVFSKELSLVYNLHHTNLLKPQHFDQCNNRPYLVLPYCEQGSALKLVGQMPEEEAWRFLRDVAAGLEYLHALEPPVIHQDIKPDNVLRDSTGTFMITDFGISTKIRSTLRKSVNQAENSGGTMAYMGPERFSKHPMAIMASDVWALGATLFELLSGDPPFGDLGGVLQQKGAEIPEVTGNYSPELKKAVKPVWPKNPGIGLRLILYGNMQRLTSVEKNAIGNFSLPRKQTGRKILPARKNRNGKKGNIRIRIKPFRQERKKSGNPGKGYISV